MNKTMLLLLIKKSCLVHIAPLPSPPPPPFPPGPKQNLCIEQGVLDDLSPPFDPLPISCLPPPE